VEEVEVLPGVPEALAALRAAGYCLIIVTNQPDVARGTLRRETVDAVNRRLQRELRLDGVYACCHDDADQCDCRKPQPGMLREAAREFGLDLAASFMVGDRWRDVEAGRRAGCKTILVDYGYAGERPAEPDRRVRSLAEAAEWILGKEA
jgi:D-glycero-D-manno-heptose 1,7-bisphosphate phosphatase